MQVVERKIAKEHGKLLISQPPRGVQQYNTMIELLTDTEAAKTPAASRVLGGLPPELSDQSCVKQFMLAFAPSFLH